MALILGLTLIFAGLILAMGILTSIPAPGQVVGKVGQWLGRFQTIIGIIAIILAILYWGDLLYSLVAVIAGLVLLVGILPSIPALGKYLEKLAKWLGRFQTFHWYHRHHRRYPGHTLTLRAFGPVSILFSILDLLKVHQSSKMTSFS